jgi:hypothetical protein
MGYNIASADPFSTPVKNDITGWIENYKQQFIEHSHDHSMFSLVSPDDSLIVVGPPRLSKASDGDFYIVGLLNSVQYSESANVQPMKAIGSRRHIFARTNAPVQGNISRLMVLGSNLYRALYAMTEVPANIENRNSQFADKDSSASSSWFTNLEEDLFRIPFGMGIIYNSPSSIAENKASAAGAEYIEVCSLVNRSVSKQSGQAIIMEQVTFMADRIVPWKDYAGPDFNASSYTHDVGTQLG